jgi:hypothetical protein
MSSNSGLKSSLGQSIAVSHHSVTLVKINRMKFIGDDDDEGRKRNYLIMLRSMTTGCCIAFAMGSSNQLLVPKARHLSNFVMYLIS